MKILVRLGPDVVIKSDRVRARFLTRLVRNIKQGFKRAGVSSKIINKWSRIFIDIPDQDLQLAKEVLLNTFGVSSISVIEHICEPNVADIQKQGLEFYKDRVVGKTFRVSARRSGVGGFSSLDVNLALGGELYPFANGVNLKHPEINISVEIHPEGAMFFSEIIQGSSGLPIGKGGRTLCLVSGGFDSIVAAYLMMRRGIDQDFLFCNIAGKAYERSVINVTRFFFEKYGHGSSGRLFIADFSEITEAIKNNVSPAYAQVILKRMFYRFGEKLALHLKCEALVTGEAVAQVSSQTLTNLCTIESCVDMPVLRPLIGFDKQDIIHYARKMGTFDMCAAIQEYCQLVPDRPVTAAPKFKAQLEEDKVDLGLLDMAFKSLRLIDLKTITEADLNTSYLYVDQISDETVIDIRTEEEFEEWHYPGAQNIEWGLLLRDFKKLDKSQKYILYCPLGLQSVVMAEKMQAAGFASYSLRGGTRTLINSHAD